MVLSWVVGESIFFFVLILVRIFSAEIVSLGEVVVRVLGLMEEEEEEEEEEEKEEANGLLVVGVGTGSVGTGCCCCCCCCSSLS